MAFVADHRSRFIISVVVTYALLALAWIFLSDQVLLLLADQATIVSISTIKGFAFVLISAAGFFAALRAVPDSKAHIAEPVIDSLAKALTPEKQHTATAYAFALLLSLLMLALRYWVPVEIDQRPILILFVLPIIVSALLGGLGPGLLATCVCALGTVAMHAPNVHHSLSGGYELFQWGILIADGVAVSVLSEILRQALRRLERNRRMLDTVISGKTDAVFLKDLDGRYLLVNAAAARYVSQGVKDILGQNDAALFDAESVDIVAENDRKIIEQAKVSTSEEHLTTRDGKSHVFLVTKGPVFGNQNQVVGIFGIARDITEHKNAQDALAASELALKQAQHMAGIGTWTWDLLSGEHQWTDEVYLIFGRERQLGPCTYEAMQPFFSPESWLRLSPIITMAIELAAPYECDLEVLRPDGGHRWVTARGESSVNEDGKVIKLLGTLQDITEAKLALLQLKASEERLLRVIEATSDGFWDWNVETGRVFRSNRYYEVIGVAAGEDTGYRDFFKQLIHPEEVEQTLESIDAYVEGRGDGIEVEFRLARTGESERWLRVRGKAVIRRDDGRAKRVVGTIADITERKRMHEDLQCVLNEAGDAIWITNSSARFVYANPAACKMTGHGLEAVCSLHIPDVLAPEERSLLPAHLELLARQSTARGEWRLQRADGSIILSELTTVRMRDGRYMAFGRDITEQRAVETAMRERKQQLTRVLEGSDQGYWDWNLNDDTLQVSARWETMLDYEPGEMNLAKQHWRDFIHPDDYPVAMETCQRHISGELPSIAIEMRCKTKTGKWRWVLSRGKIVAHAEDGSPLLMSGTHTDITERKLHELAQLQASTVFDNSYEGIMVAGPDSLITKVNPAFSRITGYTEAEVIGRYPSLLSSGRHDKAFYAALWHSVEKYDFWRGEIWNRRKNGEVYAELLSISAVRDAKGQIQHYIGIFSDISRYKAHEAELDRAAHYDPLTGLPNRRLLADRLAQSISRSARSGKSSAVCMLDLDGFKAVNDEHGHAAGDKLLIGITEHLRGVLRGDDTLARLGGDEFVVILSEVNSPEECTLILDRLLLAATVPVQTNTSLVSVSASIGISMYPADNVDADTLLRHADQAMYLAKEAGKNRYQLFDPESDRKAQSHRIQVERLREALARDEFVLYYQPKVDLFSGEIVGAEALIRWQHPERGVLPPSEFLPHVYGSDLEQYFGEWVIRTALSQIEIWLEQGLQVEVSANVSANHLLHAEFFEYLDLALKQHPDVPPTQLELEVLETAAIDDMQQAVRILTRCKSLGVKFALDDFGTGYSSLAYLRKLPLDTLKIDQSFVRDMLNNADDLGIVEGVIRLAGVFNHQVIAEGVETMAHGAQLRRMGCRLAQGYGISRPMPADRFPAWCETWADDRAWLGPDHGEGMQGNIG